MGITISSKNHAADMGWYGFQRFREFLACLASPEFGRHYALLSSPYVMHLGGQARIDYFKDYDARITELIMAGHVRVGVARFCYANEDYGKAGRRRCRHIYNLIKDCDDEIIYGYVARPDCAKMRDMKQIFRDCAENGGVVRWE